METAMRLAAIAHVNQAMFMNTLYWLAIMCVVFKLTWIIRQVSSMRGWHRWSVVVAAGFLAFVMLAKGYLRFEGGDDAQWIDIIRELSLCLFLTTATRLFREPTKRF